MTEKLREHRQSLNDHEAMADAQAGCVPCKLCGGRAVITDAGAGAGYYVRCENSGAFRSAEGCMVSDQRLGGWAYNVMDWWNRLHSFPTPAADEVEAVARAIYAVGCAPDEEWERAHPRTQMTYLEKARAAIAAMQARSAEPAPVSREIAEWNAALDAGCSQDAAIARVRALPAEPAGEEPVAWMYKTHLGQSLTSTFRRTHYDGFPVTDETPLYARPATPTNPERLVEAGFRPMSEWDSRDRTVLLLVDYSDGCHALDDAQFAITIGHNNDHNVGEDEGKGWEFAGWCWSHDHYVQGEGMPVGWMPLPHHLAEAFAAPSECASAPNGRHQVDTSMESGPNNCFHCEAPMPSSSAPLKGGA
ncbi:hypothetical protein [Novosphingobium sp. ST904]|uniref:hypothetical protein n=1 Tax=Novosphingobium sp. ST904 TaxID=1684385 RepID=UPI0006C88323|nr:hypothetical protein [Novosphingobium sp. ST904]TCM25149.1 hypothetical protein EDF59_14411 [Novosphingobium sp. ST904]